MNNIQMKASPSPARASWVDYAKAIGIILVVYGHVARGLQNAGITIDQETFRIIDSIIYTFHMPLFFFLSGLFFYTSYTSRKKQSFWLRKIDTIIYPYLLWSILQGCIEIGLSRHTNNPTEPTEILSIIWQPHAHFWFLHALIIIFAISSLFTDLLKKHGLHALLIFSTLIYLGNSQAALPATINNISNNLIYFSLGMFFSNLNPNKVLSSKITLLLLIIAFTTLQVEYHISLGFDHTTKNYASLALASIGILLICSISLMLSKINIKLLEHIGSASMAIYLAHILSGSGTRIILSKFLSINDYTTHLILGLTFGIALPILLLKASQKFNFGFLFSAKIEKSLPLHLEKPSSNSE